MSRALRKEIERRVVGLLSSKDVYFICLHDGERMSIKQERREEDGGILSNFGSV